MPIKDNKIRWAIILNAFVMPGSGHIFLGEKTKGYLLGTAVIVLVLAPLMRFMLSVMQSTATLTAQDSMIASSIDAFSVAWSANSTFIICCLLGVVALWIYGIVDVWRKSSQGGKM